MRVVETTFLTWYIKRKICTWPHLKTSIIVMVSEIMNISRNPNKFSYNSDNRTTLQCCFISEMLYNSPDKWRDFVGLLQGKVITFIKYIKMFYFDEVKSSLTLITRLDWEVLRLEPPLLLGGKKAYFVLQRLWKYYLVILVETNVTRSPEIFRENMKLHDTPRFF